jgi:hypothetical protein
VLAEFRRQLRRRAVERGALRRTDVDVRGDGPQQPEPVRPQQATAGRPGEPQRRAEHRHPGAAAVPDRLDEGGVVRLRGQPPGEPPVRLTQGLLRQTVGDAFADEVVGHRHGAARLGHQAERAEVGDGPVDPRRRPTADLREGGPLEGPTGGSEHGQDGGGVAGEPAQPEAELTAGRVVAPRADQLLDPER